MTTTSLTTLSLQNLRLQKKLQLRIKIPND